MRTRHCSDPTALANCFCSSAAEKSAPPKSTSSKAPTVMACQICSVGGPLYRKVRTLKASTARAKLKTSWPALPDNALSSTPAEEEKKQTFSNYNPINILISILAGTLTRCWLARHAAPCTCIVTEIVLYRLKTPRCEATWARGIQMPRAHRIAYFSSFPASSFPCVYSGRFNKLGPDGGKAFAEVLRD